MLYILHIKCSFVHHDDHSFKPISHRGAPQRREKAAQGYHICIYISAPLMTFSPLSTCCHITQISMSMVYQTCLYVTFYTFKTFWFLFTTLSSSCRNGFMIYHFLCVWMFNVNFSCSLCYLTCASYVSNVWMDFFF